MLSDAGIISYQGTIDSSLWSQYEVNRFSKTGIDNVGENLTAIKRVSRCLNGCFGNMDDYLQFTLKNTEEKEKTFSVSFMFRFKEIAIDSDYTSFAPSDVTYELPLKLVSLEEDDKETILQKDIKIPYRCYKAVVYNKEYFEIIQTVTVPAGKAIRLRLKLDGNLPLCQTTENHVGYDTEPHPVGYSIDNIAVSSGNINTISMKTGETYQLQLDTMETDTVEYQTNSYLAQYTHSDKETSCTRFNDTVATVNESGLITANTTGKTACIVTITHADGSIERKQCIVEVTE